VTTATIPMAPSTIGISLHTSARPVDTSHHPTTSLTAPATMTATCIGYARNRVFTATSAVKAVTTAR
jgi:hypothetical protein